MGLSNQDMHQQSSDKQAPRTHFKAKEGRYQLQCERTTGIIPFQPTRWTRITIATLNGGAEHGTWAIFNVWENMHICRDAAIDKEPTRSVALSSAAQSKSFPTCHAHYPCKDNHDLIVGMSTGEVILLSVRAQLNNSSPSSKAQISCTYNLDGVHENNRCNCVAWVPKSEGTMFVAGYQTSGTLLIFKKSISESSSKFSLGSSSNSSSKSHAPVNSIPLGGGGINDLSFSPDGTKLAAAFRDGILRIIDIASNSVVGGFQSYYGGLLCCCFSPDGQYVATGGEDDLVAMYSVQEKCVSAWGEGHNSWVSRVAFDPRQCELSPASSRLSDLAPPERVYRLASVGHDTMLCLWDFITSDDVPTTSPNSTPPPGHMRKASSGHNLSLLSGGSTASGTGDGRMAGANSSFRLPPQQAIAASTPRAEMHIMQPIMQHRIHQEPLSDVAFLDDAMLTSCHAGYIRRWLRPRADHVTKKLDPMGR